MSRKILSLKKFRKMAPTCQGKFYHSKNLEKWALYVKSFGKIVAIHVKATSIYINSYKNVLIYEKKSLLGLSFNLNILLLYFKRWQKQNPKL